ncbi:MAG: hypothetical protein Q8S11_04640 [Daejeonella sp.]|uniref:hypothetical protein n=1 Tax=Daejeonella sp. TaxID=2805397 RepID=UPI002733EAA8|nr:hypothetical protein [Daejeonella sp.]MDP3467595.1 hypothetical protein [Daejeonella sp.]
MKNLFHISVIILIFFNSCKQERAQDQTQNKLIIRFNADSNAVELRGLAIPVLEELKTDSLSDSLWANFFAVYEEPGDPEMRDFQQALEGIYSIEGGMVRFKPKDNFRENHLYFARCYTKLLLQDADDLIQTRELFLSDGFTEHKFIVSKR